MNYVLYDDDPDGFGAAFAAWLKFGDAATYLPVDRGDEPPVLQDADGVFVVDFNFPRAVTLAMKERYPKMEVIDHHQSAKDELSDLPYCHFDLTKSAAVLAFEFFHPDENVPAFFGYIQDADLWQWALPMSREVHLALKSHDKDFDKWQKLSGVTIPRDPETEGECLEDMIDDGKVMMKLVEKEVEHMANAARTATFILNGRSVITFNPDQESNADDCYRVPVANASTMKSEVCHELLQRNPNAKFSACYHDLENGLRAWALRGRDGFDVAQVAKRFAGGGHKQSAGFRTYHDSDYGVPVKPGPTQAQ